MKHIKNFANFFSSKNGVIRIFRQYPLAAFVTLFITVWTLFLSEDSIWNQGWILKEIRKEKANVEYYEAEIEKNKQALKALEDMKNVERIAREKYLMAQENEVIFLIDEHTNP